jgi:hypothetical protein
MGNFLRFLCKLFVLIIFLISGCSIYHDDISKLAAIDVIKNKNIEIIRQSNKLEGESDFFSAIGQSEINAILISSEWGNIYSNLKTEDEKQAKSQEIMNKVNKYKGQILKDKSACNKLYDNLKGNLDSWIDGSLSLKIDSISDSFLPFTKIDLSEQEIPKNITDGYSETINGCQVDFPADEDLFNIWQIHNPPAMMQELGGVILVGVDWLRNEGVKSRKAQANNLKCILQNIKLPNWKNLNIDKQLTKSCAQ